MKTLARLPPWSYSQGLLADLEKANFGAYHAQNSLSSMTDGGCAIYGILDLWAKKVTFQSPAL